MSSGVITSGLAPKLTIEGLNSIFGLEYKDDEQLWSKIFTKKTSNKQYEESITMSSFGLALPTEDGGAVTYQTEKQGFINRTSHINYRLGYQVTRNEVDDNLYNEVASKRMARLGRSFNITKEMVHHAILNNGFATVKSTGDGVSFLNASHPVATGGVQSNLLAGGASLSESSLETLITQIRRAKDNDGKPIKLRPTHLIIPPELEFTAERILKSALRTATDHNDTNAIKNLYNIQVVVTRFLTSTTAWYLKTDLMASDGLIHFQRVPYETREKECTETLNLKHSAYERYSADFLDFRCMYASAGA